MPVGYKGGEDGTCVSYEMLPLQDPQSADLEDSQISFTHTHYERLIAVHSTNRETLPNCLGENKSACVQRSNPGASPMKSYSTTIAIFGGDSRQKGRWDHLSNEVTYYTAPSLGGNGEQRRLAAAIKGGRIKAVYVLVKWIGHSASSTIKTLCHQYNVPYRIIATNHHI